LSVAASGGRGKSTYNLKHSTLKPHPPIIKRVWPTGSTHLSQDPEMSWPDWQMMLDTVSWWPTYTLRGAMEGGGGGNTYR